MNPNYHKQFYNNQEFPTKINTTESKLARMLAIDSSEEDDGSNHEKNIIIKAPRATWKIQNSQKLKAMMAKLKKDITVVMNYGDRRNEEISEHHIFIRLDLLNTYIEQVIYVKDVIKRGGTIFLESLFAMQKKTNDTLNKIREDVFKAYLDLETEDKYNIARQGGQMTCIFTVLGVIERELHSAYEKISQAIRKKNEHRNKNNKAVTELFNSFRSLPVLKCSKQKSKERLTCFGKRYNEKNCMDDLEPDNIPPDKQKACENFEGYNYPMKHQVTAITNPIQLGNTSLKTSITSCLHNLEKKLKNNYSTMPESSDNVLYEDCSSHAEIGHLEYKATGFEISISDENIQIKIPTSIIYLVRNSNHKSNIKSESELGENFVKTETDHTSVKSNVTYTKPTGSNSSVTDLQVGNTISEESVSSFYTDIHTDSETGVEFAKENGYSNPISTEHEVTKNIGSSEIKTNEGGIIEEKSIFSLWKENKNLASEYGSKICDLSNPLFGNILQLVDLIKKIYCDSNTKTTFDPSENLEILSNINQTNSLTSAVLQHYNDCPPSISQSSLEYPSIWKESASRLCELCPGCISLSKVSNEVL